MNQEHYMDLHALKNEGWTNVEIAQELNYRPATVAKWLNAGGPPGRAATDVERPVMTAVWRARIEALWSSPLHEILTDADNSEHPALLHALTL